MRNCFALPARDHDRGRVAQNATAAVTFSEAMAPATVDATSFALTSDAGPVTAAVTYDDATRAAALTPDASLAPATRRPPRRGA